MDLTSIKTIKELTKRFDFRFSKGLGQNFLTDASVLDKIVEAAEIEDGVLEIGPGFGVLTQALAQTGKKVVSVEVDERLLEVLAYTVGAYDNVKIVHDDIMKMDLHRLIQEEFGQNKISIAANLPYYITTPILGRLLEGGLPVHTIVVMVQKEVADRICSVPARKEYGALSVMCQYYTRPSVIARVPAGSFMPPPKVDSAVVKFEMCEQPNVRTQDKAMFFRVVKASFAQRRKTLLNCLSGAFPMEKAEIAALLESVGISPSVRGETLGLTEFAAIADALWTASR